MSVYELTSIKVNADRASEECCIRQLYLSFQTPDGDISMDNIFIEQKIICASIEDKELHESEAGKIYLDKDEIEELIWALQQMRDKI